IPGSKPNAYPVMRARPMSVARAAITEESHAPVRVAGRPALSQTAAPSRTTTSAVVGFIVAGPGTSLVSHGMSSRQPASAATPMTMNPTTALVVVLLGAAVWLNAGRPEIGR